MILSLWCVDHFRCLYHTADGDERPVWIPHRQGMVVRDVLDFLRALDLPASGFGVGFGQPTASLDTAVDPDITYVFFE